MANAPDIDQTINPPSTDVRAQSTAVEYGARHREFMRRFTIDEVLNEPKEYFKYVTAIERIARSSGEMRDLFQHLKKEVDLNTCSLLRGANLENTSIELHHFPLSLYDITDIVLRKRLDEDEPVSPIAVAAEVVKLHYKGLVGLIPVTTTIHELIHSGKVYASLSNVYGDYSKFLVDYRAGVTSELLAQLEGLSKVERSGRADMLNQMTLTPLAIEWSNEATQLISDLRESDDDN